MAYRLTVPVILTLTTVGVDSHGNLNLPVRAIELTQNSPEVGVEHKMLEDNLDSTVEADT